MHLTNDGHPWWLIKGIKGLELSDHWITSRVRSYTLYCLDYRISYENKFDVLFNKSNCVENDLLYFNSIYQLFSSRCSAPSVFNHIVFIRLDDKGLVLYINIVIVPIHLLKIIQYKYIALKLGQGNIYIPQNASSPNRKNYLLIPIPESRRTNKKIPFGHILSDVRSESQILCAYLGTVMSILSRFWKYIIHFMGGNDNWFSVSNTVQSIIKEI